jgi:hypothetical protein|tara:strand:- start:3131 stop:4138 length:1008 start_codon:yes stop_codon:yes gene_type:complete
MYAMKEEYANTTVTQTVFESIDTVRDLKDIENMVKQISDPSRDKHPKKINLTRLLRINEDQLSVEAPLYYMNPYVEVFFSAKSAVLSSFLLEYDLKKILSGRLESNYTYQNFRQYVKEHTSNPEFKMKIRSNRKSERKREVSTESYIDAFIQKHARLIVVRLDLYLTLDTDRVNYTKYFLKNIMYFWSQFRRDIKESKAIPNPEGFIGSFEYGHIRGFHFHVILIYDGSKNQRDVYIAQEIGEHWKNKITGGKGSYNNCNLKASLGGYGDRNGTGRIDHYDKDKINNFKDAAYYLCKTDFALQAVLDNERTYFRGNMPKLGSARGRRRRILSKFK